MCEAPGGPSAPQEPPLGSRRAATGALDSSTRALSRRRRTPRGLHDHVGQHHARQVAIDAIGAACVEGLEVCEAPGGPSALQEPPLGFASRCHGRAGLLYPGAIAPTPDSSRAPRPRRSTPRETDRDRRDRGCVRRGARGVRSTGGTFCSAGATASFASRCHGRAGLLYPGAIAPTPDSTISTTTSFSTTRDTSRSMRLRCSPPREPRRDRCDRAVQRHAKWDAIDAIGAACAEG